MRLTPVINKLTSSTVIACYLTVCYVSPAMAAADAQLDAAHIKADIQHGSTHEQMGDLLKLLTIQKDLTPATNNSLIATIQRWLEVGGQGKQMALEARISTQVLALQQRLQQEQQQQLQMFDSQGKALQARHAPASILSMHNQVLATVKARQAELKQLLNTLQTAQQSGDQSTRLNTLQTLQSKLNNWNAGKQPANDFKTLAWGTPNKVKRAPINADDIKQLTQKNGTFKYTMNNGRIVLKPEELSQHTPHKTIPWSDSQSPLSQQGLQFGFSSTPLQLQLVANTPAPEWPVLAQMPETVLPQDTLANPDVQITDEIKQLAATLHNNPAEIYKWVYDNIDYSPTFGSVQGSQQALNLKRANSFDTSSLLIALLRASNVPARYVYGTIDVPTNIALDWVGGAHNADAAQQILGQGGVPNVGLTAGSVTQFIRMEHVWVEAYVPYVPNRGGWVGRSSDIAKVWLPMDASYKIHNRTAGINLSTAVPFDAQGFINDIKQGATIDEATGMVQNIDQAKIKTALDNYQARVKTYMEQNKPNATVGDVLGTTQITPFPSKMLAPNLPYTVTAVISDYHTLPDSLRHFYTLKIYDNATQRANGDAPQFSITLATATLQGKPMALSFKPANQDVENTLKGYLTNPDGTPKDPKDLPTTLPSYALSMLPEFSYNGQTLLTGTTSYGLGEEITVDIGYQSPNDTQFAPVQKIVHSGEYLALGYSLEGISQKQLDDTKTQLEQAKTKLASQDEAQLATLTKHDITGAMAQAGVLSYMALNQTEDYIAGVQANAYDQPFMSFGTFGTYIQPNKSYGVVSSAKLAGMMMDFDRLSRVVTDLDNDRSKTIAYMSTRGPAHSANEHLVPEQLFDDPNTPAKEAEGVSAVKALQIAASQGQKIFTITAANINQVLPQLSHKALVMQDVKDAVAAGKEVTISERTVSTGNWTGTGYVIIDPPSGAGAYMIGGGADGGMSVCTSKPEEGNPLDDNFCIGMVSALSAAALGSPSTRLFDFVTGTGVGLGLSYAAEELKSLINNSKCLFDTQKQALTSSLGALGIIGAMPSVLPYASATSMYLGMTIVVLTLYHLTQINKASELCS